jgi:glycerophosphoryl diester phosphodiesterase
MVLKKPVRIISLLGVVVAATAASNFATAQIVGDRPAELVESLTNGELKSKLQACAGQPVTKTEFSIAHRAYP